MKSLFSFSQAAVLCSLILTGCATPSGTSPSLSASAAQAIAFAQGADNALLGNATTPGLLDVLSTTTPPLIPAATAASLKSNLVLANGILQDLSAATPPAATANGLLTVESYINEALSLIVQVAPQIPAASTYTPEIDAAVTAIQVVEAFINAELAAQGQTPLASPPVASTAPATSKHAALANPAQILLNERAAAAARGMTLDKAASILNVKRN